MKIPLISYALLFNDRPTGFVLFCITTRTISLTTTLSFFALFSFLFTIRLLIFGMDYCSFKVFFIQLTSSKWFHENGKSFFFTSNVGFIVYEFTHNNGNKSPSMSIFYVQFLKRNRISPWKHSAPTNVFFHCLFIFFFVGLSVGKNT